MRSSTHSPRLTGFLVAAALVAMPGTARASSAADGFICGSAQSKELLIRSARTNLDAAKAKVKVGHPDWADRDVATAKGDLKRLLACCDREGLDKLNAKLCAKAKSMMAETEGKSLEKEAQPAANSDSDVVEFVRDYQIPNYTGSAGAWTPAGQSTIEQMLSQIYDSTEFGQGGAKVSRRWRSTRRKDSSFEVSCIVNRSDLAKPESFIYRVDQTKKNLTAENLNGWMLLDMAHNNENNFRKNRDLAKLAVATGGACVTALAQLRPVAAAEFQASKNGARMAEYWPKHERTCEQLKACVRSCGRSSCLGVLREFPMDGDETWGCGLLGAP